MLAKISMFRNVFIASLPQIKTRLSFLQYNYPIVIEKDIGSDEAPEPGAAKRRGERFTNCASYETDHSGYI